MPESIDFLFNNNAQGAVANAINTGVTVGMMKPFIGKDGKSYITVFSGGDAKKAENYKTLPINTNATLRRDEWKALDDAVLAASRDRLVGITDLENAGLVYNLANGFGTTVLEHHTGNDPGSAQVDMDGLSRGQNDAVNRETVYLPIPIIHVDYQINARLLATSRNMGNPLDTTQAESAARRVAEKLEEMLFTNVTYGFGGGTIYSYLNHPSINTETLSKEWASTATAAEILTNVINMKKKSIAANHYGPWVLYIPNGYEAKMDQDFSSSYPGLTIRQRLLQIDGIKAVKVADRLTANKVVLVQMTSDTVRLVKGMGITNVEWKSEGNFVSNYKVLTIQVPQIRADQNGKCGVTLLSA